MKHGKKYVDSAKLIDHLNAYDPAEACELACKTSKAKFDETIEISVRLGVDPRHADQQVRGAVVLPHGTGRTVRVLVVTKGDKVKEAEAAGADIVGGEEMIHKIQTENWFGFDVMIATPDMMGVVGRIGRILGPKGLMPNPKSGTVTMDVARPSPTSKPVRSSTAWTRPPLFTAPSERPLSAPKSWVRTCRSSWTPSTRPSPAPPRAPTFAACTSAPPWAPPSRSTP